MFDSTRKVRVIAASGGFELRTAFSVCIFDRTRKVRAIAAPGGVELRTAISIGPTNILRYVRYRPDSRGIKPGQCVHCQSVSLTVNCGYGKWGRKLRADLPLSGETA